MVAQHPKTIRIAEGKWDVAQLVNEYLEKGNLHPNIAKTGVDARTLLVCGYPHLVLLDLMLTEMDGCKAWNNLRYEPETALLPK